MKSLSLITILFCCGAAAAAPARHDLKISIDPEGGTLKAEDRVTLETERPEFFFTLHEGLSPASPDGEVTELPAAEAASHGINFSTGSLPVAAYRLALRRPASAFRLSYGGRISHPLGETAEDYARSFSETPGTISSEGCYLAGASGWYPHFEGSLVSFRVEASLPPPYQAVAGGLRSGHRAEPGANISVWESALPHDEITLVCGRYAEYSVQDGPRRYYAFLRSHDKPLADKYLSATARYIRMYSELLGDYPYPKFALVENFWETGYGLPSFTLLGPKVIRLPFIINSSYPHEILHNWWGNGVFVDYASGNWCEGLTAYLADYLISEGRGKSREYRMAALQKYSDYVRGGADFPLTAFRSRHSSASEAVGYGKSMMVYHMLRRALGDEGFVKGLRAFYAANRNRAASFSDLRTAFEKVTGPGRLAPFFSQWVERAGAPELALSGVKVSKAMEGYDLEFTLAQKQPGEPYELEVPVAVYLEGLPEPRMKTVRLSRREDTFHYAAPARPARIEVDPEFDVFRKLSPLETAPSLSRVLGAERPALLLPAGAAGEPWQALAERWTKDKANLPQLLEDSAEPPARAAYWLFGEDNLHARDFESGLAVYGARFTPETVTIGNRRFERASHTFVFAAFNPSDPAFSAALVESGTPDRLPLLASKLPHYGKYSWLVFDAGMNSAASGIWEVSRSPLAADIPGPAKAATGRYPARRPLAYPPSDFSAGRIAADVKSLASAPGGRAPGTKGHSRAAELLRREFRKAGLIPFEGAPKAAGEIWLLPGTSRKDEYLALAAHFDHLPPAGGAVFPGADDNASGTALLLELARYYGQRRPERSLIFAAFDGEELGRLGSKAFLAALPPGTRGKVNAALNFDTIGRLGSGKLLILSSGSSDKWVHIFRGAGFVTGMEYDPVKEDLDSSDQQSFIEAGIPAVQFFTGPHADYHKPGDTADKVDAAGVVKQAEFAKEMIDYLAGASEFLTRPSGKPAAAGPAPERKVSTGLVPDFTFPGPGVRAQEITPGSPLAAAGVKAGDVITAIDGQPTPDLRAYSAVLKKLSPGRKAGVTYLSDGAGKTAEIELAAR